MSGFLLRLLQVVFGVFVLAGFAFAFFSSSSLMSPITGPIYAAFWTNGPPTPETLRFAEFAFGMVGGLTIAVGVSGWFVTRFALAKGQRWAWFAMAESLLLWFIVDGAVSIHTGAWINAVFNSAYFLAAAVPLVLLWPTVRKRPRRETARPEGGMQSA